MFKNCNLKFVDFLLLLPQPVPRPLGSSAFCPVNPKMSPRSLMWTTQHCLKAHLHDATSRIRPGVCIRVIACKVATF